jgi:DNA-binding LacI/PurR family transcriptional regulator
MASIKDVAELAGVSVASVSRVLNTSRPVGTETHDRVIAAARQLNYSIDQRARAIRLKKSGTLGLIVADVGNPFTAQVISTIEAVAYRNGHDLFLCNSDEDEDRERLHCQAMAAQRIGGVIVLPVSFSGAALGPLLSNAIPVICLDRKVDDLALDAVLVNNDAGGTMAAVALFEAGHRRIAVLGAGRTTPGRDRLIGFRRTLLERGVRLDDDLVRESNYKEDGGYSETLAVVSREPRPTALFIVNHPMTIGALRAIRDLGLRVPRDISVLAFDDPAWAQLLDPALSTLRQPTDQLGTCAAEMLIERVAGRYVGPARLIVLQPLYMERASVAPPAPPEPADLAAGSVAPERNFS